MFWTFILDSELVKILYVATCACIGPGQPFNAWFYPAFHHYPYTFWFTYHGITWLSGVYSLLWWLLNSPAYFGYWTFNTYLLTVDGVFLWLLTPQRKVYAIYYALFSPWFIAYDPVDFFIVLFIFLGRFNWKFLAVAILTKLPIGSEILLGNFSVWQWVLTNPNSLHGPENYGRYLILVAFWTVSLVLYLYHHRNRGDRTNAWNRIRNRLSRSNTVGIDRPATYT